MTILCPGPASTHSLKTLAPCNLACPNSMSEEACYYENLECIPSYWEIQTYLEENIVWACHSNRDRPCSATGLKEFPEGSSCLLW